jgi:glycosyltransferase involved in cell wall biosynthesis
MKIAIPIIGFGKSGGYRVLSNLANEWVKMGHTVTFLSHVSSELPYFPTSANILWLSDFGTRTERNHQVAAKKIKLIPQLFALTVALSRYFRDFDTILANHSFTAWSVFFCQVRARKTYYIQAYEPEYYQLLPGLKNQIMRFIAWSSYFFPLNQIVNSEIYMEYKNISAKHVVPPGLDSEIFFPLKKFYEQNDRNFIVGCIGTNEPQKGIRYIYEAMENIAKTEHKIKLRVAFNDISSTIEYSFQKTLIIPSNDRELADFYRSVDVLIAPGIIQLGAAHYPVMEAMSCGTAVITTGYFPANQENSWIIPISDVFAIQEAIIKVKENQVEAQVKVLRGLDCCQSISWENVAREMLKCMNA